MKILLLCHRFPYPPDGGAKIRPFHMIRHLQKSHQVTVASLVRDDEEERAASGLAEYCERYHFERIGKWAARFRMVFNLLTRTPSSMGFFHSPALHKWVRAELARENYDLIITHCSSMAPYVEHVTDVKKILDFTDMDSQKWLTYVPVQPWPMSWGYKIEGTKLARAEAELARKFDLSTTATAAETETLDGFGTGAASGWFPNGVDSEYFSPSGEDYDPDLVVFLGRMDYYPNRECMLRFADDVMPKLQQRRPGTKLRIVGANPPADVRALGDRKGIEVTGSVPDVRPHLLAGALSVAPLTIARGTQNKILEALAAGVPVVSSRLAARGTDAVPGEHLLTADTPDEYCDAILRLLDDPAEREKFSVAGRKRMLSHHSWDAAMERLDQLIQKCLVGQPAKAPVG